jgi:putative ABC transport system permease protein
MMEIRPILSTLGRHKIAAALIAIEIALTCAILCNALLMIGDRIVQMTEISGVAEDQIVRVQAYSIGTDEDADARTHSDLAALRAIPGVSFATVVNQVPFFPNSWNGGVRLQPSQNDEGVNSTVYLADEQFVDTLGVKLIVGRSFEAAEYQNFSDWQKVRKDLAIPAALITSKLAERLFPGQNALGKDIYMMNDKPTRIVGILEHLVRPSQQGGSQAREYTVVVPMRASYVLTGGSYLLRTQPERRADVLQAAIAALRAQSPNRVVTEQAGMTLESLRHEFFQQQRSMAWLLGGVILVLLIVTALGIAGLASFWVQQRTRQIGVRRALGATRGQILRYFQTENFLITTAGILLGMLLAFGINQFLMMKFELPRLSWIYLPVGAMTLWTLGQLAVLWPARRAAAVPPAVATRSV